ncbi:MAG: molybdenum cofactor guanylyltransferase, partial [Aquificaceae bacterium]|nr:molybdenum cofactor guanylyltransferase [Aquificaceae bacterium]
MTQGFVLAGGQSRRFGEDKLLYLWGGKRLIEYPIGALKDLCDRVYVVTKEPEKFFFLQGVDFLCDLLDRQFALSGLYTVLRHLGGGRGLVVAGDMPMLQKSLLLGLLENSRPPLTLFRISGRLQPMQGVYYPHILPQVEAYMAGGG